MLQRTKIEALWGCTAGVCCFLCLTWAKFARLTGLHSSLKATVLAAQVHKAVYYTDDETALHEGLYCNTCKCWSLLCHGTALYSKHHWWSCRHVWRKASLPMFTFNSMYRQDKTRLQSASPLKRATRSNQRDYKAFLWGILLGNLNKLCRLYKEQCGC